MSCRVAGTGMAQGRPSMDGNDYSVFPGVQASGSRVSGLSLTIPLPGRGLDCQHRLCSIRIPPRGIKPFVYFNSSRSVPVHFIIVTHITDALYRKALSLRNRNWVRGYF